MIKSILKNLNIKKIPFIKNYGIIKFPIVIKNSDGKTIYSGNPVGYWIELTYDENGNCLTYKDSVGSSSEYTYDEKGNCLTCKDSKGYLFEKTYDERGNLLTYKDSNGLFVDYRPKQVELTLDEIANKFNIDVKQLKIKK